MISIGKANLSVDFTGGTNIQIRFKDHVDIASLRKAMLDGGIDDIQIQVHYRAQLPIVMCVAEPTAGSARPGTSGTTTRTPSRSAMPAGSRCTATISRSSHDTVLKAFSIAEQVSIPVMVCYDGYILSHTYMPFELPDQG